MKKKILAFSLLTVMLVITCFISINLGSIEVSAKELFEGLFISYNAKVAVIYDLRFPRIIIAMLAGAALAASGVLFQAVMKNPLADPSIIGVSSGASFAALVVTACFPQMYLVTPLIAAIGGLAACTLVYALAWKNGLRPVQLILTGIAISSIFTGFTDVISSMGGSSSVNSLSVMQANISMKTWKDVYLLFGYVSTGLILALCVSRYCNLLALEDKTLRALGQNVQRIRIVVSFIAVILASIATAVAGSIAFLGLVAPHIARSIIGQNHKWLLPFSMLLGSFILLFADTVGRVIIAPYEISASIICAIVGGPFLIFLIRRSSQVDQG